MDSHFQFGRGVLPDDHRQLFRLVAHVTDDHRQAARSQVLQEIVARLVGYSADVGSFYLDVDVGQVLTCLLVKHVPDKVCVVLALSTRAKDKKHRG